MIFWISFLILSLIVEVYLWWKLQASLIFLSGRTCTIGGWLNTFLPHCIYIYIFFFFFLNRYPIMVKCLNIGNNIGKPIYRSISSNRYGTQIKLWLIHTAANSAKEHKLCQRSVQWGHCIATLLPSNEMKELTHREPEIMMQLSNNSTWQRSRISRLHPTLDRPSHILTKHFHSLLHPALHAFNPAATNQSEPPHSG